MSLELQARIEKLERQLAQLRNLVYADCRRCGNRRYLVDGYCSPECALGQVKMPYQELPSVEKDEQR